MNENAVRAVFRTLAAKFPTRCSMIGKTCIVFKSEPIRLFPGRVQLRGQSFPCKSPADLLKIMQRKGLLRLRNLDKMIVEANQILTTN
jgi:hypothetical protein